MNLNFTSQERILKAKISLNTTNPFFSYILMNMNIEQTKSLKNIPTMGVNKYGDLYWNDDFVNKLSENELKAVLCHEAMHVATLTFDREGTRDKMLWNIATDIVINTILLTNGFKFPKNVLLPDKDGNFEFTGKNRKKFKIKVIEKSAEEVYDMLISKVDKVYYQCGNGENGDGNYKGQVDSHLPDDKDSEGKNQGKDKNSSSDKANKEKWKKISIEAATNAKMRGKIDANIERMLEGILEPKIDWRKKLYRFLTKDIPVDYTMRLPGRRFYTTGVYYPSVIRENLEIICLCDCSGSINYGTPESEGGQFISEAVGIADSFQQIKMRFIWWGTEVHPKDDITINKSNKTELIAHTPAGGGGTYLSCTKRYIKSKGYKSKIYVVLTDGYIENNPELPDGDILFVLSKSGSDEIIKKYGDVTKLSDVENE